MRPRSVKLIWLYQILTLGFYFVYWCWRSKNEVNHKTKTNKALSAWWFLLPFGGYWWAWQYAQAVEEATNGKIRYVDVFGLFLVATMIVVGSLWLPFPEDLSSDHISAAWLIGYFGVLYAAIVSVAAIFPVAMQGRFNRLAKS